MHSSPSRSTFVTVVAWIFIVFSGFTTLIGVMQNIMVWTIMRNVPSAHASQTGGVSGWMASHVHLFFLGVLLSSVGTLVVSIGLLRRRSWARVTFIGLLSLGILWFAITIPLQWVLVPAAPSPAFDGPEMESLRMVQLVIRAFTTAFSLALAGVFGWLIKRMLSPAVRDEFSALHA